MTENQAKKQIKDGLEARGYEVLPTHDARRRPIVKGISDLIAIGPGKVLFVEVKGEGGVASDMQLAFITRMRGLGHTALVAHSFDDVKRFL